MKNKGEKRIPWNKGIPMNQIQKNKISKTRIERGVAKGKNNPRWGTSKYRNEEERKKAKLAHGRKSYRKHLRTRLFHCRQLSFKRRNAEGKHTIEQWESLKQRYNYCCRMCGMKEPFENQYYKKLTEDHIVPISKGGSNNIENIQPLCWSCNSKKSNRIIN